MALSNIHSRLLGVSRVVAATGGLGIIAISLIVTVDVMLRKFFGTTLGGATEVSGFIFAVATAFAYPYVLLDRANVRIDVVYTNISPRLRAILDLLALFVLLYFVTLLTYSVFQLMLKSWRGNTMTIGVVNFPLWIPQLLWVVGYVLLTLTAVFLLIYALIRFAGGNWLAVNRVAGVPNIEELIEEETHVEFVHPEEVADAAHRKDPL